MENIYQWLAINEHADGYIEVISCATKQEALNVNTSAKVKYSQDICCIVYKIKDIRYSLTEAESKWLLILQYKGFNTQYINFYVAFPTRKAACEERRYNKGAIHNVIAKIDGSTVSLGHQHLGKNSQQV